MGPIDRKKLEESVPTSVVLEHEGDALFGVDSVTRDYDESYYGRKRSPWRDMRGVVFAAVRGAMEEPNR